LPISLHLLRQMPYRIVDYSGMTSFPTELDFTTLKTCRSEAEIPSRGASLRQHRQRRTSLYNRSTLNLGFIKNEYSATDESNGLKVSTQL